MSVKKTDFLAELAKLGVPARLCARLKAFLKARHPGDQARIYHGLAHTYEVSGLTARMLHSWPRVPAERKVFVILSAAMHDLDPQRPAGTPARVEATLAYLHADPAARALIAEFCDRFHFTPGQVAAMVMATDYSDRPAEKAAKLRAFRRAHRYAFGNDPWIDEWGRRLAYWDQIATYVENTPQQSRRRVAGLARELRRVRAFRGRPESGMQGLSRRFLAVLKRDDLFSYLTARDRARFETLLKSLA